MTFFWDDNITQFTPWYEHNYQSLLLGEIPQINYYQYLGDGYLGNSQNGFFYPPTLLATALGHLFHSISFPIQWLVWIHLIAAALTMDRFARELGVSPRRSPFVAWLFLVEPITNCAPQAWVHDSYVALLVPLSLLQALRLVDRPTPARIAQLALIKALFALSGNLNLFAFSLLFEALFLLTIRTRSQLPFQALALWLFGNFLAGLIALPTLSPTFLHLSESAERARPMSIVRVLDLTLPPVVALCAQFGSFLTRTYVHQAAWVFLAGSPFYGALLFVYRSENAARRLFLLAIIGIALCTPGFYLIHLLPGYGSFRWGGKFAFLAVALYAPAVGLLDQALRRDNAKIANYAIAAALALSLLVSISGEGPPISKFAPVALPRYLPTFHLPLETLRLARSQPLLSITLGDIYNPDLLTYNYATLAQVPVMNGYNALVTKQNKTEALEDEFIGIERHSMDAPLFRQDIPHLQEWSVAYYLTDSNAIAPPPLVEPEWTHVGRYGPIDVWQDPHALPLAFFEAAPQTAIPVTISGNELHLAIPEALLASLGNSPQILSLGWVPLHGFSFGTSAGPDTVPATFTEVTPAPTGRMKIPITLDSTQPFLTVRYSEPYLTTCLIISASTLLLCLVASVCLPVKILKQP